MVALKAATTRLRMVVMQKWVQPLRVLRRQRVLQAATQKSSNKPAERHLKRWTAMVVSSTPVLARAKAGNRAFLRAAVAVPV